MKFLRFKVIKDGEEKSSPFFIGWSGIIYQNGLRYIIPNYINLYRRYIIPRGIIYQRYKRNRYNIQDVYYTNNSVKLVYYTKHKSIPAV